MKLDLPSVPCCSFWETQPIRSSRGGVDDFGDVDDTKKIVLVMKTAICDGDVALFHLQGIFDKKEAFKVPFAKYQ